MILPGSEVFAYSVLTELSPIDSANSEFLASLNDENVYVAGLFDSSMKSIAFMKYFG
jgi:hypothetical protein